MRWLGVTRLPCAFLPERLQWQMLGHRGREDLGVLTPARAGSDAAAEPQPPPAVADVADLPRRVAGHEEAVRRAVIVCRTAYNKSRDGNATQDRILSLHFTDWK